jgi:hypothetical protein
VAEKTSQGRKKRKRMGRPLAAQETARRNRVVTMVTDSELEKLSMLADQEDKSLSAVVHQILSKRLKGIFK